MTATTGKSVAAPVADNSNDTLLAAKIESLLHCSSSCSSVSAEVQLVAAVLLTRIQSDAILQEIVQSQAQSQWLTALLLSMLRTRTNTSTSTSTTSSEIPSKNTTATNNQQQKYDNVIVRLACLLILRIPAIITSTNTRNTTSMNMSKDRPTELGQTLLQIILARCGDDPLLVPPLSEVDISIIMALERWLEILHQDDTNQMDTRSNSNRNHAQAAEIMNLIWRRVESVQQIPIPLSNPTKVLHEDPNTDWQLCIQTLEAVLQRDSSNSNSKELTLAVTFQKGIQNILLQYGAWICKSTQQEVEVKWYQSLLLQFGTKLGTTQEQQQRDWHIIIFLCTLSTFPTSASKTNLLKTNSALIWNIIMTYIVETSHVNDNNIRCLAWATSAHLVDHVGWNSRPATTPTTNTLHRLGSHQHMCLFTRLASGEYRLQLDRRTIPCQVEEEQEGEAVLSSTCQIIVAAFQNTSANMSPDALLHLRHSFHDAYHSTMSYLVLTGTSTDITAKLLGCMLTEFSIWEEQQEHPETVLHAVQTALETHVPEMLPGIVTVMDSMQGSDNETIFRKILGPSTMEYLLHFWNDNHNDDYDLIAWACQASDLLYSLDPHSQPAHFSLAKLLLCWIQSSNIDSPTTADNKVLALSMAAHSYVVLLGETVPSEQDASIIQHALCSVAAMNSEKQVMELDSDN